VKDKGFEEIPHTADWAMRVWANDLPSLFEEAARGMNALAGVKLAEKDKVKKHFEAEASDWEALLVSFLSELIYFQEQENLGFSRFDVRIFDVSNNEYRISADMEGAPIQAVDKAVKAVTFHNLKILKTARGLEVEIVLDV
jgi:SHS2 domain-containing protein